jgi:hypothetical protein
MAIKSKDTARTRYPATGPSAESVNVRKRNSNLFRKGSRIVMGLAALLAALAKDARAYALGVTDDIPLPHNPYEGTKTICQDGDNLKFP